MKRKYPLHPVVVSGIVLGMSAIAERIAHQWQIVTPAKFCAQWYVEDWEEFISDCHDKGLDIDSECLRLYEEQGDF